MNNEIPRRTPTKTVSHISSIHQALENIFFFFTVEYQKQNTYTLSPGI
jgi:hypothetical protein